jgi:protein-S-isoprenylcysteine O-methyltransferase Ste14
MERIIIFGVLSIPLILVSWRTLFNIRSHGVYRFLSWEAILWLLVSNFKYWFVDPFRGLQIFSWFLLIISGYLVIAGGLHMKRHSQKGNDRNERELFEFEKTGELVDKGIFGYIRHPLYASLLFLTWGIWLKNPTWILFAFAVFSSLSLFMTATIEEKECIRYFGNLYREYIKRTKRFIPFIF